LARRKAHKNVQILKRKNIKKRTKKIEKIIEKTNENLAKQEKTRPKCSRNFPKDIMGVFGW
jgi:proteasome assembly chaperone (PAC2) family protein